MKKVKKFVEQTVYIASDGKEFLSDWECEGYEDDLIQEKKEEEIEYLRVHFSNVYPPTFDNNTKRDWLFFKINNQEELLRFCDVYKHWVSSLASPDCLQINYPDIIALVDYPRGPHNPEIYLISDIFKRWETFLEHMPKDVLQKYKKE